MTGLRLYDIANAYRDALDGAVDPETGEVTETLAAALDALGDALTDKVDAVLALAAEAGAEAAALKAEEERLKRLRTAAESREGRLRAYVLSCLEAAGVPKVKGARFQARVQAGKERVVVEDASLLPTWALRFRDPEPDKDAIKRALKDGKDVGPGAHLEIGPKALVVR